MRRLGLGCNATSVAARVVDVLFQCVCHWPICGETSLCEVRISPCHLGVIDYMRIIRYHDGICHAPTCRR